jgi:FkbM family methyltransferase
VLRPAAWTKSVANQLLLGVDTVPEFWLLKPLIAQLADGWLVDAGANIGLYTLLLRSVSMLPIVAYEPQPFLFQLLRWNIAYNGLPNVQARNIACGASRSVAPFWLGLNGSVVPPEKLAEPASPTAPMPTVGDWEQEARIAQKGGAVVNIPVTTLDEDLADLPAIALLKIDCEGFEYRILQGARCLLKRHRPLLFIEVHPQPLETYGDSTQALLDLIAPAYDLEFWYFRLGHYTSKLARSLAKFRRPRGHRCTDAAEMLTAAASVPGPAQIYFLGRPKRAW